jgi:hypothetical protein
MEHQMSGSMTVAKVIRIAVEQKTAGLFIATSPDIKGLVVAAKSEREMAVAVPTAIRAMYEACDVSVMVTPLENSGASGSDMSWVAVPSEIARRALEAA